MRDQGAIIESLARLTPADRARRGELIELARGRGGSHLEAIERGAAAWRAERRAARIAETRRTRLMDDAKIRQIVRETLTAAQVPVPPPPAAAGGAPVPASEPLKVTPETLAKMNSDHLAVLSAEAWGAYGDTHMKSPFWRAN